MSYPNKTLELNTYQTNVQYIPIVNLDFSRGLSRDIVSKIIQTNQQLDFQHPQTAMILTDLDRSMTHFFTLIEQVFKRFNQLILNYSLYLTTWTLGFDSLRQHQVISMVIPTNRGESSFIQCLKTLSNSRVLHTNNFIVMEVTRLNSLDSLVQDFLNKLDIDQQDKDFQVKVKTKLKFKLVIWIISGSTKREYGLIKGLFQLIKKTLQFVSESVSNIFQLQIPFVLINTLELLEDFKVKLYNPNKTLVEGFDCESSYPDQLEQLFTKFTQSIQQVVGFKDFKFPMQVMESSSHFIDPEVHLVKFSGLTTQVDLSTDSISKVRLSEAFR